jgi:hypothetical protein
MSENSNGKLYVCFKDEKSQINFEFAYLIVTLVITCLLLWLIYQDFLCFIKDIDKKFYYAFLGAFLGGWAFDAKWFYRGIAGREKVKDKEKEEDKATGKEKEKEKHPEETGKWNPNRFYWRMLIPFISAVVGFSFYLIVKAKLIPFIEINQTSGSVAFGFSFIFGYFSDMAIGKMSDWICAIMPKDKNA